MTHTEIEELLGAYALDAVEPDEAAVVELHLRDCPRCRGEVAEHREIAALLAHQGAPAPDGVWDAIAGSLEESPPPLDLDRVVPLRGRRGPGRIGTALLAVAAAVALVLGVVAVQQSRTRDDQLAIPAGRSVRLQSPDGKVSIEAVLVANGTGYLVGDDLPRLPRDRTYQLWGVIGEEKISLGVLGAKPELAVFQAKADVSALAVTEEKAGGVVASKNPPVVVGAVPESA